MVLLREGPGTLTALRLRIPCDQSRAYQGIDLVVFIGMIVEFSPGETVHRVEHVSGDRGDAGDDGRDDGRERVFDRRGDAVSDLEDGSSESTDGTQNGSRDPIHRAEDGAQLLRTGSATTLD